MDFEIDAVVTTAPAILVIVGLMSSYADVRITEGDTLRSTIKVKTDLAKVLSDSSFRGYHSRWRMIDSPENTCVG